MKRDKAAKVLKERSLEAIHVSDPVNMRYLSGYTGGEGCLLLTEKRSVLLTDGRYTTQAEKECPDFTIEEVKTQADYGLIIERLMKEDDIGCVGFENLVLKVFEFESLKKTCRNIEWRPLDSELNLLRIIKSEEEISDIKEAQKIADKGFEHILGYIKPGIMEQEIALELEYFMRKNGAERLSFDIIAASGIHSAMPHAVPDNKELESGDFLTLDFGCVYQGYCSDMTRTVVIGKASDEQKKVYQTVLRAQEEGLSAIQEGCTGIQADKAARDVIEKEGYGKYFSHSLGHGVGLYIHENPRLSKGDQTELKENMIVTVEPGIYIPDFGGVRIEDMVAVKRNGYDNFAVSPKELLEIS